MNRDDDIISLPDFCAISNPAPDLGEPKLGSEPLPPGNHCSQMSYLHHGPGDIRDVICLDKKSESCQPPRRTDLLLVQLPSCSIALWDVTLAL